VPADPQLPGIFRTFAPLLNTYGYLAVGGLIMLEDFGIPVPGETALIAAAIYAGAGRLNIVVVATVGFVAAIAGDNIGYAVGHFGGRPLALRWGRYVLLTAGRLDKAQGFFARHGAKIVTIARFIEGLRQANGIIAGIAKMHWLKFLAFNALGAALWVSLWATIGYTGGNHINTIYHAYAHYEIYGAGAIVAVVAGYVLTRLWRRQHSPTGPPPSG
jgi:membrane protein DedA with SNARE-associated domain